jgi:hypothetical protein
VIGRLDDVVVDALMVPFSVIVGEKLKDGPAQLVFAEGISRETVCLDGFVPNAWQFDWKFQC